MEGVLALAWPGLLFPTTSGGRPEGLLALVSPLTSKASVAPHCGQAGLPQLHARPSRLDSGVSGAMAPGSGHRGAPSGPWGMRGRLGSRGHWAHGAWGHLGAPGDMGYGDTGHGALARRPGVSSAFYHVSVKCVRRSREPLFGAWVSHGPSVVHPWRSQDSRQRAGLSVHPPGLEGRGTGGAGSPGPLTSAPWRPEQGCSAQAWVRPLRPPAARHQHSSFWMLVSESRGTVCRVRRCQAAASWWLRLDVSGGRRQAATRGAPSLREAQREGCRTRPLLIRFAGAAGRDQPTLGHRGPRGQLPGCRLPC